jgi:hypothetical protein
MKITTKLLLAITALTPGIGAAQLIQINFAPGTVADVDGWNRVTMVPDLNGSASLADLLDASGAPTGISLAVAGFQSEHIMSSNPGVPTPAAVNTSYTRAWNTGATPTVGTVSFSGLATGQQYSMIIFGSRLSDNGGLANRGGQYSLGGAGVALGAASQVLATVNNTAMYLTFDFTTTALSGDVTLQVVGWDFNTNAIGVSGEARGAALNSIQLATVPEPSATVVAIAVLALLAFAVRRGRGDVRQSQL